MDKIICVGKNYLKHAAELGDAIPEEPLYFLKPPSTIVNVAAGQTAEVTWPAPGELHHELEIVLRLQKDGAGWRFSHYTFGLDMTRRDLQQHLKKAGQPWEKAKVFQNSTILGPWQPVADLKAVLNEDFELKVNGKTRQHGRGIDMRWKPEELLIDLQRWFPLCDGDILFTGTPEGVGPIGDRDTLDVITKTVRYSLLAKRH